MKVVFYLLLASCFVATESATFAQSSLHRAFVPNTSVRSQVQNILAKDVKYVRLSGNGATKIPVSGLIVTDPGKIAALLNGLRKAVLPKGITDALVSFPQDCVEIHLRNRKKLPAYARRIGRDYFEILFLAEDPSRFVSPEFRRAWRQCLPSESRPSPSPRFIY